MIAEVGIYKGSFPGVMMIKLYELHSARKDFFANKEISEPHWLDICCDATSLIRRMYRQESDVTTSPLNQELRIGALKCDDTDYMSEIVYEDRMHKLKVDQRMLPKGFREGYYSCSMTLSVDRNFWLRNEKDKRIINTLDQANCRLMLNILERTGDIVPRPLTLWEHWSSEFRRTFMEDS